MKRPDSSIDCTVIVVNYRTPGLTIQALRSLYTHIPAAYSIEVIVVDNASGDDSVPAIRAAFPQCLLIESPINGGFAKANNIAMMRARGRYFLLLNSDTIVLSDAIGTVISYMDQRPSVGIAGCRLYFPDMSHQHSLARLPSLKLLYDEYIMKRATAWYSEEEYSSSMPVGCLIGAFMMVSRNAVEAVSMLDERYFMNSEDTDWCKRMWDSGFEVHYCADTSIIHIGSQSINLRRNRMNWELHKNRVKYFLFNHGVIQAITAMLIICSAYLLEPFRTLLRKAGTMNLLRRITGMGM